MGLNVNNTVDEGPTLHYSINNGTFTAVKLNPVGAQRTDCDETACDWSATLNTLERGDYVSYYATATDVSTEGSTSNGANVYTTSTNSFEVADPTKMLIVEWRDMGYDRNYLCDYQAVFYDVTNEIEFKYDTNCDLRTDYMTVGYMDHTKTHGATMRNPGTGYLYGGNPFTTNYRITTDGTDHSFETFPLGMTPVTNAQAVITGASNGGTRGSLCDDTYYWNQYSSDCNANIDIPSGFSFDYFQKTFDGDDSNDRLRIGRLGYLYFIDSGSTALERGVTAWNTNMPPLPSTNTYARPGTIAPWWHSSFYGSNYCYKDTATDCAVYVRVLPFEGKELMSKAILTVPTTTLTVSGTRKAHLTESTLQPISFQSQVEISKSCQERLSKSDKAKESPLTERAIRSTLLEHLRNQSPWKDKTVTSGRDFHSRMIVPQPTTDTSSHMSTSRTQVPLLSPQVHATVTTTLSVRTVQVELVHVIPTVTSETSL